MSAPQIRELSDGDFCVDYGHRWYRVRKDRTVESVWVKDGSIKRRPATPRQTEFAIRAVLMRE